MATFGNYLRSLRTTNGYSQDFLAKKIGVSKASISYWESDSKFPNQVQMSKLFQIFPTRKDGLISLYFNIDGSKSIDRLRDEVISSLWIKADNFYKKFSSGTYGINLIAEERFSKEKLYFLKSINILIIDFLSHLREIATNNSQLITIRGKYNSFLLSFLFGATRFNPIESRYLCPSCSFEKCNYENLDNNNIIEQCEKCGTDLINVSQFCDYPFNFTHKALFLSGAPRDVDIDVSPSFAEAAINIAVSYFSPLFSLKKQIYKKKNTSYIALMLDQDNEIVHYDSINEVPEVDACQGDLLGCQRIFFHPELLNQKISERLCEAKPDLVQIYNKDNIISLANSLKKQLPKQLQQNVESVSTIDQLVNLIIVINQFCTGGRKSLDCKVINELKKSMNIHDWTRIPFTKEDYQIWKSNDLKQNPDLWQNTPKIKFNPRREEYCEPDYIQQFKKYGGNYSKGEYSDVLYRQLLDSYFFNE